MKREPDTKAFDYLLIVLRYIAGVREPATEVQIKNLLLATYPVRSEEAMETLAQAWENKAWERGMEKGLEKGLQEGLQQGKLEAMRSLIFSFLNSRYRDGVDELQLKVESLNPQRLESLSGSIFDFSSRTELEDWLNTHCG
ncbi:MAG: DUF4351 domain-containing protein [Acidobacteriota bacterium]